MNFSNLFRKIINFFVYNFYFLSQFVSQFEKEWCYFYKLEERSNFTKHSGVRCTYIEKFDMLFILLIILIITKIR